MKTLITNYIDFLLAVILAGAGGAVRMLVTYQSGTKRSWLLVISEVVVAGFAGLLVDALLRKWGVDSDTKIMMVAASGYAAREVLELLRGFATGAIGALVQRRKGSTGKEEK